MVTFGNTTEDEDGIDRGPREEDRRTLDELRGSMRDIAAAKKTMGELATVQGMVAEIQVLKQQLGMTHEQMRRLIGMYATLQQQFQQFQAQRVKELTVRVNSGPTNTEDFDGPQP